MAEEQLPSKRGYVQKERERVLRYFVASPDRGVNETITNALVLLARTGVLNQGDLLPGAQQLAKHLGVSHISVERSYAHLKDLGIVTTDRRRGTRFGSKDRLLELHGRRALSNAILACRQMEMSQSAIKRLFMDCLSEHFEARPRSKSIGRPRS